MDDGDILRRPSKKSKKRKVEVSLEPDVISRNIGRDTADTLPTSEVDQYKYFLSTRTSLPDAFFKRKIEERFGHLDFDTTDLVLVLSILAKCFIRKKMEAVMKTKNTGFVVSVQDLIHLPLKTNERFKLGIF
jgi:hypothetical protein